MFLTFIFSLITFTYKYSQRFKTSWIGGDPILFNSTNSFKKWAFNFVGIGLAALIIEENNVMEEFLSSKERFF